MDSNDDSMPLAQDPRVISIIDYEYNRREKRDAWFDRVVYIAVTMVILLYVTLFAMFIFAPQNWHIQIILAIMPTAIVISLLNNLNSKNTDQKQESLSSTIPTATVASAIKEHN